MTKLFIVAVIVFENGITKVETTICKDRIEASIKMREEFKFAVNKAKEKVPSDREPSSWYGGDCFEVGEYPSSFSFLDGYLVQGEIQEKFM